MRPVIRMADMLALLAVTTLLSAPAEPAGAASMVVASPESTRIIPAERCLFDGPSADGGGEGVAQALGSAVLNELISQGVSASAAVVKAWVAGLLAKHSPPATTVAAGTHVASGQRASLRCVTIVRGVFGKLNEERKKLIERTSDADPLKKFFNTSWDDEKFTPLQGLGLADWPIFYAEIHVDWTNDNGLRFFKPELGAVYVRKSPFPRQNAPFNLVLVLTVESPGGAAAQSVAFTLPNLKEGQIYERHAFTASSPWLANPAAQDVAAVPKEKRTGRLGPVNVPASLQFWDKPNEALEIAAQIVGAFDPATIKTDVDAVLRRLVAPPAP